MKKTKIICTLGPASFEEKTIKDMIKHGMNCARLNLSHGNTIGHLEMIKKLKRIRDEENVALSIMLDNKGPEIRIGEFSEGMTKLEKGEIFTLTTDSIEGNHDKVNVKNKKFPCLVQKNTRVLLDDGNIELCVKDIFNKNVVCEVIHGGVLKNNKSINLPDVVLNYDYIKDSDISDLDLCVVSNVEYLALSFVSKKEDVLNVRKYLADKKCDVKIISKIENIQGVKNIDEIIDVSDGIMVARGDLGVEIDYTKIPAIQKEIISKCGEKSKIVITATQMLESMTENPRPTRAEISDVANAVLDGTSCVMLSGETASGKFPIEAVKVMSKIVREAEKNIDYMERFFNSKRKIDESIETISHATISLALNSKAKLIVVATKTGQTANCMGSFVSKTPILACTPDKKVFNCLALVYANYPVLTQNVNSTEEVFEISKQLALKSRFVYKGDTVVLTAGEPKNKETNQIQVVKL